MHGSTTIHPNRPLSGEPAEALSRDVFEMKCSRHAGRISLLGCGGKRMFATQVGTGKEDGECKHQIPLGVTEVRCIEDADVIDERN